MSIDIQPHSAARSGLHPHLGRSRPSPGSGDSTETTPAPPPVPGRRNPKWIALGVVALCLGGLLSYAIYARLANETAVVTVAQTVYRGEVIDAADLTTITLQGNTIARAVPAADLDTLIGKRAAADLVAGSVLVASAVTDEAIPESGRAVVGLKLSAGRTPTSLLLPSAAVRLVALPSQNGSDSLTGDTFTARIIDQANGPDGTSILVNVDVSADQAAIIAQLAAQDRIALVRDAGR
ncbi:MAG TPA: SAF domain-containing protein [Propionibacteriaceae bacterium]|nr:SAF domain-containing protein [Propionibacteriaceae bacterium]